MEDALHDFVVAATGLPAASVYWANQSNPRPAAPCVSMLLLSSVAPGMDWVDVEDAPYPAPEAEIEEHVRGPRVVFLSLQCFAASATGTAAAGGILSAVVAAARQSSRKQALREGGWGVGTIGPVQVAGGATMNTTVFEPRATLQMSLHAASDVSETATFVEIVEIEGEVD